MLLYHDIKPPEVDIDEAADYVDGDLEEVNQLDEKRCLRRVDIVLVPVMFLSMAFHHIDQVALAGATLLRLLEDLDLADRTSDGFDMRKYNRCSMIFYPGYLLGTPLAVYLSQKAPLGRFVSVGLFVWGVVSICTTFVTSYEGLLVQRFFLGFAQASVSPAFSLITAMWYRPHEQPLRITIWLSAISMANLVCAPMICAIGKIQGVLSPWQYEYIIFGSATSLFGVAVWFILPDNPMTAWFLTPELRKAAIRRVAREQIGIENKSVKPKQIKEAFVDPKSWAYVTVTFCLCITNGALSGAGPLIVESFGYTREQTSLLMSGAGAVGFLSLIIGGTISVFYRNTRIYVAMFTCLPVIAGAAMVWKSKWDHQLIPLFGVYMMCFFATPMAMTMSLVTANTAGHTKKAAVAGMQWAAYCIGSGTASRLVLAQERDQHFPSIFVTIISTTSFAIMTLIALRFYLMWTNYKREKEEPVAYHEVLLMALMDKTDGENSNFRYQM
ncbi:major facilitator superfamily domain-containing protein [Aspergillus oleicola]